MEKGDVLIYCNDKMNEIFRFFLPWNVVVLIICASSHSLDFVIPIESFTKLMHVIQTHLCTSVTLLKNIKDSTVVPNGSGSELRAEPGLLPNFGSSGIQVEQTQLISRSDMRCENCILPFTTRDAHTNFYTMRTPCAGLLYNEPGIGPHTTVLLVNYKKWVR